MSRRIVVLLVVCAVLAGVVPLVMVLVNGQPDSSSAHAALASPVMQASSRATHPSPLSARPTLGATVVARVATTTAVAPLTPTARQEPTPTAQPPPTATAPPWTSITLAKQGISVGVPPGWKASTSDFAVTIVNAAVRKQSGSRSVLDPHGVLFLLQPWDGPPPTEGQTVTVGEDRYPGRLETPTTKPRSAGAASAVRIAYTVGDYTWDIEGEFGSAVGSDSPERAMFNAIVQSIHHDVSSRVVAEPTPTLTPDEQFSALVIQSPQLAVNAAWQRLYDKYGGQYSQSNPLTQFLLSSSGLGGNNIQTLYLLYGQGAGPNEPTYGRDMTNFASNLLQSFYDPNAKTPVNLLNPNIGQTIYDALNRTQNSRVGESRMAIRLASEDSTHQAADVANMVDALGAFSMDPLTLQIANEQLNTIYDQYLNSADIINTDFGSYLLARSADWLEKWWQINTR